MKLAMSVGDNRHYRVDEIRGDHYLQTARRARLFGSMVARALHDLAASAGKALSTVETQLPPDFPHAIHASISRGVRSRLSTLQLSL